VTRAPRVRGLRAVTQERAVLRPAGLRARAYGSLHTLRVKLNAYSDDTDTDQPDSAPDQPDSYWRRRAITLAAGLSLLAVLAWALSGGGGKPASPMPRSSQASGVLPAVAYSSGPASPAAGGPGSPAALASGTASGHPAAGKSANRASALAKPALGVTPQAGREPGGGCAPSAVVLSLFSRPEYYRGQDPGFDVYAVSTAAGTCSFDVGHGKLHVVVMSAGRIIWDSADCARRGPSRAVRLSRGVPAQELFTWNRAATLPGCVTLVSSARLGSYQVQAGTGSVASPVRTFKLVRLLLADA
jgi:hypothetical protein